MPPELAVAVERWREEPPIPPSSRAEAMRQIRAGPLKAEGSLR